MELLERFEAAHHPRDEPHYFLSLLGTHPAHAGRGLGMALLAENLQRIDSEHMPAYLESSNPGDNHRYERYGFVELGTFYPPSSDIPSRPCGATHAKPAAGNRARLAGPAFRNDA